MSCGPYHTAAVTSDGFLYTWGNGLFGKLGHGNHASFYSPRKVVALEGYHVLSVACGWWHTAAVASLNFPPDVYHVGVFSAATLNSCMLNFYVLDPYKPASCRA